MRKETKMSRASCTVIVNFDAGKIKLLSRKPVALTEGWEIMEGAECIPREKAEKYLRAWSSILKPAQTKSQIAA